MRCHDFVKTIQVHRDALGGFVRRHRDRGNEGFTWMKRKEFPLMLAFQFGIEHPDRGGVVINVLERKIGQRRVQPRADRFDERFF